VNLLNKIAVEGNVALTRGQQVLRGERFTYNFLQDRGSSEWQGEIYLPTAGTDFSETLPTDVTAGGYRCGPQSNGSQPINRRSPTQVDCLRWSEERQHHPCRNRAAQLGECVSVADFYIRLASRNVRITNDPLATGTGIADKVTLTRDALARPNQDDQTAFGV